MKRYGIILAALALVGCERAEIVESQEIGQVETTLSCHHFGYCYTVMPGFDGSSHAGFKLSAFCPGSQPAIGQGTKLTLRYLSKPEKLWTEIRTHDEVATGPCT